MPASPHITLSALFGSLLAMGTTEAVVHSPEGVSHFYGSNARPQIEIRIEESEGSPIYLSLDVLD